MSNPFSMIGLNTHVGNTVDIEIWRKPGKDSWGDKKFAAVATIEGVALASRTTSANSNDAIRERVQSGYTMYLDQDSISLLRAGDEIRFAMPDGNRVVYELDGFRQGGMWDLNPLSNFQPGNEVNLKFVGAEVQ